MKKLILTALWLSLFLTILSSPVSANDAIAGSSAQLKNLIKDQESVSRQTDPRVLKLEDYLKKQNSDLDAFASVFVKKADENSLDWRLLPAIAGVESTFAKFIPPQSSNPFGWGVYGQIVTRFPSFKEAIETVADGLGNKYPSDLSKIARIYCPSNCQKWLSGVTFFMKEIDDSPVEESLKDIGLTL